MDANLIGWLALLLASIVTPFIMIQVWQRKTTDFVHRGFFESVGGEHHFSVSVEVAVQNGHAEVIVAQQATIVASCLRKLPV